MGPGLPTSIVIFVLGSIVGYALYAVRLRLMPVPAFILRALLDDIPVGVGVLDKQERSRYLNSYLQRRFPALDGQIISVNRDITERVHAEEKLHRQALLLESVKEAVIALDLDYIVTDWNRGAEALYGYTADEALGKPLKELIVPDTLPQTFAEMRAALAENETWQNQQTHHNKAGESLIVEQYVSNLYGVDEKLIGFIAVGHDMTAGKRADEALRHSEERFRAMIENSSDLIVISDVNGVITYTSPSVSRTLGYESGELLGRRSGDYIFPTDIESMTSNYAKLLSAPGTVISQEGRVRHKDGSWLTVEFLSTNLLNNPSIQGIVTNARDVTERQRNEEQIRRRNEYLTALHETTLALMDRLELDDLLQAMITRARSMVSASEGFFYRVTPGGDEITAQVVIGPHQQLVGATLKPGQGLAGKAWQTGQLQVVEDYVAWPGAILDSLQSTLHACMAAPLKSGETIVGVLAMSRFEPGQVFSEDEIELFKHFVELASIALDNAQLYSAVQSQLLERTRAEEKLRQQNEYLTALNETTLALMNRLDVGDVMEAILNRAGSLLGTPLGSFNLLEPDDLHMKVHVVLGPNQHLKGGLVTRGEGLVGEVWKTGQMIVLDEYLAWAGALPTSDLEFPHAIVAAPLKAGEQIVGVLDMAHSSGGKTFSSDELELFQRFVELASIALDNARLYSASQSQLVERTRAEEKLRRQNEFLTALNETTFALMNRLDVEDLLEAMLNRASTLLGAPLGFLYLLEPNGIELKAHTLLGQNQNLKGLIVNSDRGLVGKIWKTGQMIVVDDYVNWSGAIQGQEREYPRATIGAPLKSGEQVIGVIGLAFAEAGQTFTEDGINLFNRFVELASIALDNARLYGTSQTELVERTRAQEKLRQQNEYLTALNETTLALMNRLEVDDLIEAVLNRAASLLHTPQGYFYLLEPDGVFMRARVMLGTHQRLKGILTRQGEGLVGEVWKLGDIIVMDDYAAWEGVMPEMVTELPHAIMVAPLKSGNLVIGVIGLAHSEAGLTFDSDEIELFKRFVELASIALDNARLYSAAQNELFERQRAEEKLRQQNEYLTVLNETTLALMNRLDVADLMEAILNRAAALIRAPQGHINLLEPDGQHMRIRVIVGPRQHLRDTITGPGDGIAGEVWRTGQMIVLKDYLAWEGATPLMVPEPPRAIMVAPLKSGDQVVGVLGVAHSEPNRVFSEDEIELFKRFVELATLALDNARLYSEAQRELAERTRAEDQLKQLNSELEQRVEERTGELQRRQAQLSAVLDAIGEGVFYNEQNQIRYTNQAMAELTGYSIDELIDQPSAILMGSTSEAEGTVISGEPGDSDRRWRGEVDVRRKDGTEFSAALTVTSIKDADDNPSGSVTVVRDITEEKRLQAQKFAFLSNASHELRTPLTNFKTRLYLVRRQPERLKEHISVLEQVTDRMTNLVEDLLDISRFERQTISLQRRNVILQHVIEDVVQVQRPEALLKNIRLSTQMPEEPVTTSVDPNRIIQVLINLIINAINYTPHGGSVAVYLSTEQDQNSASAVIRVQDTGIGIAADKLARVFEPFFRATEGTVRGTGLGLSITKEIVELHGGRISVESSEGQGSSFTVHLPLTIELEAY